LSKILQQDYQEYSKLIEDGHSQRSACLILGLNRSTIQRYIKSVLESEEIKETVLGVQNQNDYTDWQSKPKPELCNKPRICFYDIETSLAKSYHFQQWKVNLSQKQKIQESHLLSHAWAWGDGEVTGSILTREEMLAHDPERLVLECWSLLDNCDILVAHNGKRFDVKKVNSYFLQYGMPPPSPYRVIDTLLVAKQKFALPFNSLAYLAEFLDVEQKIDTGGVDLWIQCDQGSQEALDKMNEYCMGDIVTLRGVYNRLIGWSNDGVNLALYSDHGASCPHCSSDDVSVIQGKYSHTVARKYQAYRCNGCGAVLRSNRKEGSSNSLVRVV
jgi:uncharacterized protein YprB with RNaseH-like and TPR domain